MNATNYVKSNVTSHRIDASTHSWALHRHGRRCRPGRRSSGTRPSCRALPRSEKRHEQMPVATPPQDRGAPRSSELCCKTASRKSKVEVKKKWRRQREYVFLHCWILLEKCRDLDLKPKHSEWSIDKIQRSYLGISLKKLNVDLLCRLQTQLWQRANSALFFAN